VKHPTRNILCWHQPSRYDKSADYKPCCKAFPVNILVPYTLPYALTGIRQASGRALVGMVAAEFFLSTSGLGEELITASRNFDMAGVLATILVITGLGITFMRIAQSVEKKYSAWRGVDR
jgi:ABC-type nitrate/sulfonate/bicarbonate transport system permease component